VLLDTPTTEKVLAALPMCPRCGQSEYVTRSGMAGRAQRVRQFVCSSSICRGAYFLDPARPYRPSGPRADLKAVGKAIALRREGLTYREIGERMRVSKVRARYLVTYKIPQSAGNPLGAKLEVYLYPRTLLAFARMYRAKHHKEANNVTLAEFAGFIIGQSVWAFEKTTKIDWRTIVAIEE
jgi:transposase-like protein